MPLSIILNATVHHVIWCWSPSFTAHGIMFLTQALHLEYTHSTVSGNSEQKMVNYQRSDVCAMAISSHHYELQQDTLFYNKYNHICSDSYHTIYEQK